MPQISEDTLRVGLFYILKHNTGYVDALAYIGKGNGKGDGEELPDYFREIGYISYGIDAEAHRRYKITPDGKEQARAVYTELCLRQKLKEERANCA